MALAFFTTLKLIMVSIDFDNFRNVAAVQVDGGGNELTMATSDWELYLSTFLSLTMKSRSISFQTALR